MKRVKDCENYIVYPDGKLFSIKRGVFLKGGLDTDGYRQHILCVNGERYCKKIHRLVAQAYIPNPHNHPVINHKDGDKLNNNVDNLEWCTISHNTKEAYRLKALNQSGEKNNACIYKDNIVEDCMRIFKETGSIPKTADMLGLKYATAYSYIKGLRRKSAETIPKGSTL